MGRWVKNHLGWLTIVVGLVLSACDDSTAPTPEIPSLLPALSAPESLLAAIDIIYNDRQHSAAERQAAYSSLLDSAFAFHFQNGDIEYNGLPRAWDQEDEIAGHAGLFAALEAGTVEFLSLRMQWSEAEDLSPPQPGREGWKEILATDVYLLAMLPSYWLEVNGAQARILARPANDRWYIVDWVDLPRPQVRSAVETVTWGRIKATYHPEPLEPFVIPGYAAPESLIASLITIYNDRWQPKSRRAAAYWALMSEDFQFHFQPADVASGLPPSWGWLSEGQHTDRLFIAQDQRRVASVNLEMVCDPPVDLDPPQPGREGWKSILCRSVHLQVMTSESDGMEVAGDQATFLVRLIGDRWYLADWTDVPAPGKQITGISWGRIKSSF